MRRRTQLALLITWILASFFVVSAAEYVDCSTTKFPVRDGCFDIIYGPDGTPRLEEKPRGVYTPPLEYRKEIFFQDSPVPIPNDCVKYEFRRNSIVCYRPLKP